MRPNIVNNNVETGIVEIREMTEEEYAALLATGWTEEGNDDLAPQFCWVVILKHSHSLWGSGTRQLSTINQK